MKTDNVDLDLLLKRTHCLTIRRICAECANRAAEEGWTYQDFLALPEAEEVANRNNTRIRKSWRSACFPLTKTIEEFDFNFQAGLKRSVLGGFLGPELFREGHNLILSGQLGCGKAHPAISIAYRAIQNGYTARLVDASPLIDELAEAARQGRLREGTVQCVKLDRMVFTTIKRPRDGGCVLHDNDLEEVILDRVRKRGQHVQLGGSSWRNRHLDPEDLVSPSNHPENPLSPGAPQNP